MDIGGTFTDLVMYDESSREIVKVKALTTPDVPEDGLLTACELVGVRAQDVSYFMHATTLVTNLVLTSTGSKVGLLTTKGFRDVLEIGTSYRQDLYDLQYDKPKPFVPRNLIYELDERIDHNGRVLTSPDVSEIKGHLRKFMEDGVEAVAVALFNSYANSEHERLVADIVHELYPGFPLSLSSEVDPRIREYPRMSTTVLNSYAMPKTHGYISKLESAIPLGIKYMHSGAGVVPSEQAKKFPITLVASGPAAGVLAGRFIGEKVGLSDLVTIDAGGTSFDVGVIRDGKPDIREEVEVEWGIPARTQSVDINSIGAGGGSIAWIDEGGALKVGPQSAGATPGPACYGLGGTSPTVTDANLVIGLLNPDNFLGGRLEVSLDKARQAIMTIAQNFGVSIEEAALGIYRIVNAHMVQAIQAMTIRKGIDPRDFTMVAFGGAGGQHAAEVATEVGIETILVPPRPSTFSAFGLLTADMKNSVSRTLMWRLSELSGSDLNKVLNELKMRASKFLENEDENIISMEVGFSLDVRYLGQSNEVTVALNSEKPFSKQRIYSEFQERHQELYGTRLSDPAEIVNAQATVTGVVRPLEIATSSKSVNKPKSGHRRKLVMYPRSVPVFDRGGLGYGMLLRGPCIVEEEDSAFFMPRSASAVVDVYGNLIINTNSKSPKIRKQPTAR